MMNMAGNIGGALSPMVFGVLVQFGSWQAPFIVAAACWSPVPRCGRSGWIRRCR